MTLRLLILVLATASTSPAREPAEETPAGGRVATTCPVSDGSSAPQDHRRAMAAAALGDSSAEEELLTALAQAQDESERGRIVRLLGKIGTERSLPALFDLLGERHVTGEVQAALIRIDPQWRSRPEVERTVARLAASLRAPLAPPPSHRLPAGDSRSEWDDLRSEWETCWARQAKISLLATFDRALAADAAQLLFDAGRCLDDDTVLALLAEEGHLDAAAALDHLLDDGLPEWSMVDDLAEALDKADPQWREGADASRVARTLLDRLSSDSAEARRQALRLMDKLRLPGAVPALIGVLEDASRSDDERVLAARALGSDSEAARDALERCAESGAGSLELTCADVLIASGGAEGLRALRRLLASPDPSRRQEALYRLDPLRVASDPALRAAVARVCLEILQADDRNRSLALAFLGHLATPDILPQARELFARRDELDSDRDSVLLILLKAGGIDELPRVVEAAYEEPEMLPDVAQALAMFDWVPPSTLDELLDLLRARGAPPTPNPGEETDWRVSHALNTIAERLMASPGQASIENLRWLAHHPEARIRAQARYAAFKAGIRLEPPP